MVPGAPFGEPAAALPHGPPQELAAGMMDDAEGLVLEGQGADGCAAVLLGTGHQGPEPARGYDHIVIDESQVLRRDVGQGQVAGRIGGEVVIAADQANGPCRRPPLQFPGELGRPMAIDIDKLERNVGVLLDRLQ